jgi:UDP-N-acetylmuramoylalanine--D-glutamate ligase
MDIRDELKGKRITVLGLGLLGRGVGDAEFLAQCGAEVVVTDKKSEAELAESVTRLAQYKNISFHLGGHALSDFTDCDMVLKAAGVRLDSPEIAAARAAGVSVAMSTALFAKYAAAMGVKIVGVTGTRGKSTIAHMIYHTLMRMGKRAHLGGNIRGLSTLAMLPQMRAGDVAVLELDSWQLQGFGELQISPQVAVFSNLMPDHQNYYKDMDEYFADKANIFRYQKAGDTLVVGSGLLQRLRTAQTPSEPLVPSDLPPDWELQVPGEHNRHNAALAAAALLALGLTAPEIRAGLESFTAVEGRLQYVGEKRGVRIYNDNNATTPEATVAAIQALDEGKKNIVLIMGGSDKGLDMQPLWQEVLEKCKDLYFLSGSGTDRIRPEAPHVPEYKTLREAVAAAMGSAESGDILLFSPAFASFGMFKNEYERNDEFLRAVQSL